MGSFLVYSQGMKSLWPSEIKRGLSYLRNTLTAPNTKWVGEYSYRSNNVVALLSKLVTQDKKYCTKQTSHHKAQNTLVIHNRMASISRTSEIFLVCCLEGDVNVVSRILKKNRKSWTAGIMGNTNFDINNCDSNHRSGLVLAAISNCKDIVDLLLSRFLCSF